MVKELLVSTFFDVLRLLSSMALTVFSLYSSIKILDKMTVGIEEWQEIKKGNVAVGILYSSVLVSIVILCSDSTSQFTSFISPSSYILRAIFLLLLSLLLYIINLFASIIVIYLTFNLFDKLTIDVDEIIELKKGNVAIALLLSVIILSVAFMLRAPISDIFQINHIMSLLGL